MMRAKFVVQSVVKNGGQENLHLTAVSGNGGYGPQGESDDNTYARYTPMGSLTLTVNNPALFDKFSQGDKFYLDFTKAEA